MIREFGSVFEKVSPEGYSRLNTSKSDQPYSSKLKKDFRSTRKSKLILTIFFIVTLVSGMGVYAMSTPKIYAQASPLSSSNKDNVCTPEEQTENVCTPDDTSQDLEVCIAEEQPANVCVADVSRSHLRRQRGRGN